MPKGGGGIGEWEKHTRGFGSRMLEKMGYQAGKGLGLRGEGRSTPVEVSLRGDKLGLGADRSDAGGKSGQGRKGRERGTRRRGTLQGSSSEEDSESGSGSGSSSSSYEGAFNGSVSSSRENKRLKREEEAVGKDLFRAGMRDGKKHGYDPHEAPDRSRKLSRNQTRRLNKAKGKSKIVYRAVGESSEEGHGEEEGEEEEGGLEGGSSGTAGLGRLKIVDMRGAEGAVVLEGAHEIGGRHQNSKDGGGGEDQFVPELSYNLSVLVEGAREECREVRAGVDARQEELLVLERRVGGLREEWEEECGQVGRLEKVCELIEECCVGSGNGDGGVDQEESEMERYCELFETLHMEYSVEFHLYELQYLAVETVFPLVTRVLQHQWSDPLRQPGAHVHLFRRWQRLLRHSNTLPLTGTGTGTTRGELDEEEDEEDRPDAYGMMIWHVWMPFVRRALRDPWSPRIDARWAIEGRRGDGRGSEYRGGAALELLEQWQGLIPGWVRENIIVQLVHPKYERDILNWKPSRKQKGDTQKAELRASGDKETVPEVPWQTWIVPWIPWMGEERMKPLYQNIVHKLSAMLQDIELHPRRESPDTLEGHGSGIILDVWRLELLFEWVDVLPIARIITLLEEHFFKDKWLGVLSELLSAPQPDYDKIMGWYVGWKKVFPEVVLEQLIVKRYLRDATNVMNLGIDIHHTHSDQQGPSSHSLPGGSDSLASFSSAQKREVLLAGMDKAKAQENQKNALAATNVSLSFREQLEKLAEERGFLFVKQSQDSSSGDIGEVLYRFGKNIIAIRDEVVFVRRRINQNNAITVLFEPVSIQELIEIS
eukprot:Nk52_evm15s148 gene=Nk52_evmTU15s148